MARGSTRVLSSKVCCVSSFIGAAVMSAGLACGMQAASQPSTQPAGKPATDERTPAAAKPKNTKALVAKPHPLICEILYSVPKGEEGDADQNGSRSATGDEFIEIYNPHTTPIDLKGYVLSDAAPLKGPESDSKRTTRTTPTKKGKGASGSDASPAAPSDAPADGTNAKPPAKAKRSRLRFEFPALTLKPGETAVVFNGFESSAKGPISDGEIAPNRNENFANAYVFTMGTKSQFAALANDGDCVTLFAPDGRAIQCVRWGTASEDKKIDSAILMMEAPESKGSVTLDLEKGEFVEHEAVETENGSRHFSPGTFGSAKNAKPAPKPTTKPASKPAGKPPTTASSPKDDQPTAEPK